MCPNRDRRLDWTMAERWGCLVNLLTSSLRNDVSSTPWLVVHHENAEFLQKALVHVATKS